MIEQEQSRTFTDGRGAIPTKTLEKGKATLEQSARAAEQSISVTMEGFRVFNVKMTEMARANVEAVLELSLQLATAKTPSDIVELWTTHGHKQFGILSEQTKELIALGQKMAGENAKTITRSVNQVFRQAS
jgi:hypothetical protein